MRIYLLGANNFESWDFREMPNQINQVPTENDYRLTNYQRLRLSAAISRSPTAFQDLRMKGSVRVLKRCTPPDACICLQV